MSDIAVTSTHPEVQSNNTRPLLLQREKQRPLNSDNLPDFLRGAQCTPSNSAFRPFVHHSTLRGRTQLDYPEIKHETQQQKIRRLDISYPQQQQGGYNPAPSDPTAGNCFELRTSPEIIEAASTAADSAGAIHGHQQLQAGPSAAEGRPDSNGSSEQRDMFRQTDNSPLWGANEPKHDLKYQEQQLQWVDQQCVGYNPFPTAPIEPSFVELPTSSHIIDPDSTVADCGGAMYSGYQQFQGQPSAAELLPVSNGNYQLCTSEYPLHNHVLLSENLSSSPGQSESPDTGYSSPGTEIYATVHILPQLFPSMYQNQSSMPATGSVKSDVQVLKQEPGVNQNGPYAIYQQQFRDQITAQQMHNYQLQLCNQINQETTYGYQQEEQQQQEQQQQQQQPIQPEQLQAIDTFPTVSLEPALQPLDLFQGQSFGQLQAQPSVQPPVQQKTQTEQRKYRKSRSNPRPRPTEGIEPQPSTSAAGLEPALDGTKRRSARPSVIKNSDYKCEECGTYFARQCGLTQHKAWIHGERKFLCNKCGKTFKTADDLDKHVAQHNLADKPYKCDVPFCMKAYCHKNDLARHALSHVGIYKFQCDKCPKGFPRKDHWLSHRRTHERPGDSSDEE